MKWLGIDLEVNRRNNGNGVWNCGVALFSGKKTLDYYNIFIEDMFSNDPKEGYGAEYFKKRETLNKARRPVWVSTLKDADRLACAIVNGWGFSRSFGYNSSVFDLGKMQSTLPGLLGMVNKKPHLDLMPLVTTHLIGREGYQNFWRNNVEKGNTHEGNPKFAKFGAELVMNYLLHLRNGATIWKKEEHIGAEDLIDFEYPILHYFLRILKKGSKNINTNNKFRTW